MAKAMKSEVPASVNAGGGRICSGMDVIPFEALGVSAVDEEEVVNTLSNCGGKILFCGQPPAFGRYFGRVEYEKLEGGCSFLAEGLASIFDGRFVKRRAQPVQGAVGEEFPPGGVVCKPLEQVRNGVCSDFFEGRSLLHREFTMQSDDPVAQGLSTIGWFWLLKDGAESQGAGTNGECSEEEENQLLCVPSEKGAFHIGTLPGTD